MEGDSTDEEMKVIDGQIEDEETRGEVNECANDRGKKQVWVRCTKGYEEKNWGEKKRRNERSKREIEEEERK